MPAKPSLVWVYRKERPGSGGEFRQGQGPGVIAEGLGEGDEPFGPRFVPAAVGDPTINT